MSDISERMQKLRERRKAAPKATVKKVKVRVQNTELQNNKNDDSHDDGKLPIGLLASIILFIFFGAKYGIKRQ